MKTIIKSLLVLMLFAVSEATSAIAVTIQDKEVAILNITSESVTINWKKAVRTDSQKAPLYYRVIWQQRTRGHYLCHILKTHLQKWQMPTLTR